MHLVVGTFREWWDLKHRKYIIDTLTRAAQCRRCYKKHTGQKHKKKHGKEQKRWASYNESLNKIRELLDMLVSWTSTLPWLASGVLFSSDGSLRSSGFTSYWYPSSGELWFADISPSGISPSPPAALSLPAAAHSSSHLLRLLMLMVVHFSIQPSS